MILFSEYIYSHFVPFNEIYYDYTGHLVFGKQSVPLMLTGNTYGAKNVSCDSEIVSAYLLMR